MNAAAVAGAVMAIAAMALSGCDAQPCPTPEAAKKAAAAYEQCLLLIQRGDGGFVCGELAYRTFCEGANP